MIYLSATEPTSITYGHRMSYYPPAYYHGLEMQRVYPDQPTDAIFILTVATTKTRAHSYLHDEPLTHSPQKVDQITNSLETSPGPNFTQKRSAQNSPTSNQIRRFMMHCTPKKRQKVTLQGTDARTELASSKGREAWDEVLYAEYIPINNVYLAY